MQAALVILVVPGSEGGACWRRVKGLLHRAGTDTFFLTSFGLARLREVQSEAERAAGENAGWCSLVCRASGLTPQLSDRIWASRARTPPGYPDAISLRPDVRAEELLMMIDTSAGCSVKDSFANLHLDDHGFSVLFDADWIWAPAGSTNDGFAGDVKWTVVADPAHQVRSTSKLPAAFCALPAAVLTSPRVTWLVVDAMNELIGSAIVHRTDEVVGLSHVFLEIGAAAELWAQLLRVVQRLHPELPVAGFETAPSLTAATEAGFRPCGTLRVWSQP